MYGIVHPAEQWESDRNVQAVSVPRARAGARAVFYEAAGWERPQWYESNAGLLDEYGDRINRREAEWESPLVVADHQRRAPGDARPGGHDRPDARSRSSTSPARARSTSFRSVAMRQMDVAVGRVVYTPLLTPSGGFKQDLTIMRLGDDVFRVVTGGAYGMSDLKWFADHLPDGRVGAGPRPDQRLDDARPVGAARARRPSQRHERRRLARRDSRSRAARRSRSARFRCSPHGSPTSATSAGSCTCRSSRARGCGTSWPRRARLTASSPPGSACTAPPGAWRSATAPTAPSSRATSTWSRPAWPGARSRTQDFIGKEAHVRHREEEPAAIMCTLTVDDHTSASGVKRYMLGERAGADARRSSRSSTERDDAHMSPARAPDRRSASTS